MKEVPIKIIEINSLFGGTQFSTVIGEKKDEYLTSYAWNTKERCKEEFEWSKKYGFSNNNCKIKKSHIIKEYDY